MTAPLVQGPALETSVHEVVSHVVQKEGVVAVCTESTRGGLPSASGAGSGMNQLAAEEGTATKIVGGVSAARSVALAQVALRDADASPVGVIAPGVGLYRR